MINILLYQTLTFILRKKIQKTQTKMTNSKYQLWYGVKNLNGNYFKYVLKNHETFTDDPSKMIYVNKIEKRIMFKIKTECYLEFSIP